MRYLTQDEIDSALARGHFERSKQFHSFLSFLFKANTGRSTGRANKVRPTAKARIASA